MDQHIEKLLKFIAQQKCVLLIGPEIQQVNGLSITHYLRAKVYEEYKDSIVYLYKDDGFLQLKSEDKQNTIFEIREYMEALCQRIPFDEELYKMLIQLPFHMILSLNPDIYLSDLCYKYGVRHRFGYFKSRDNSATDDVAVPTREEPLIYNLCGSVKQGSLLLEYKDLFGFIKSLLADPGLPKPITDELNEAHTFLFLGFSFDKWYTQLMLEKLCGDREVKKYAARHRKPEDEVKNFMLNQFKVEFLDQENTAETPNTGDMPNADDAKGHPQRDFVKRLFNAAQQFDHPLLGRIQMRELLDPASPAEVKVIRYIQDAKIDQALLELESAAKGKPEADDIVQLRGQWTNLSNDKGRIESHLYVVRFNKLLDQITAYARQLFNAA